MARRYVRDAKGRFASKGYTGQTGGRGARLKSGKGNVREIGGQKRGERHVLRSAETRAASKRSFDAAVQSANVTLPKSLGGQGMPRNSFPAQAAARKKAQAQAERDAALRKSGLPKSGGAMRVKGGIKRDPQAGEKLKQLQQKSSKPQSSTSANKASSARTKRPTAAESRAKGLTPISEIKARRNAEAKAAQAANQSAYNRRFQSQRTKAAADAYRKAGGQRQKYSTIKNPAAEGSAPFNVTGSTYQGRKNAAAGRAARDAKLKQIRRTKTDLQVMQQADRVMEKLAKRQKKAVDNASSLESGLRDIRRNNARAGRVNQALQSRGLLGEYTRRTAPADPIRLTPAGKGIPKAKPKSVDSLNAARQKANANLDQKRAAYFATKYGTPEQKKARAELMAAEKKSNAATNAWRDAKAGVKSDAPKGSYAATKIEQAKGRVKQFTAAKKSVDAEIRQVRQQIKDARSNAMTFGDVPALKLKLLSLQGKSQEYKATIDRAKQQAKGE